MGQGNMTQPWDKRYNPPKGNMTHPWDNNFIIKLLLMLWVQLKIEKLNVF